MRALRFRRHALVLMVQALILIAFLVPKLATTR
jgi:hypothetical protein